MPADDLLKKPPRVVNVGLERFAEALQRQSVPVVHLDWAPPREKDPRLAALLSKLGT